MKNIEKTYRITCGCMSSEISAKNKRTAIKKFKMSALFRMMNLKGVKIIVEKY